MAMVKEVYVRKTSKESHSTLYLGHISDTATHVHNYYKYKHLYLKNKIVTYWRKALQKSNKLPCWLLNKLDLFMCSGIKRKTKMTRIISMKCPLRNDRDIVFIYIRHSQGNIYSKYFSMNFYQSSSKVKRKILNQ